MCVWGERICWPSSGETGRRRRRTANSGETQGWGSQAGNSPEPGQGTSGDLEPRPTLKEPWLCLCLRVGIPDYAQTIAVDVCRCVKVLLPLGVGLCVICCTHVCTSVRVYKTLVLCVHVYLLLCTKVLEILLEVSSNF